MCLIFIAVDALDDTPFCLLANRDEFYSRPTERMHWWPEEPILAGKDLQAGGTWMAIGKNGKIAAVTNYRNPEHVNPSAPSRGMIPVEAVTSEISGKETILQFKDSWKSCNGFNLILHDGQATYWYSNVKEEIVQLDKGIYGLSNAFLDSPWPKVVHGKAAFRQWLLSGQPKLEDGLEIMSNTQVYPKEILPDTGVGEGVEQMLSAACIVSPIYGTRSTTVLFKNKNGTIQVTEKDVQSGKLCTFSFTQD